MSFDWSEYLKLARELVELDNASTIGEARLRSAISRAYYAALNKAVDYIEAAEGKDYLPTTPEKHYDTRSYFFQRRDQVSEQIANNLNYLRSQRNKADYEADTRINDVMARETVRRAGLVIHQLSQLKK